MLFKSLFRRPHFNTKQTNNKYIDLQNIRYFQIGHTSRCNLLCPQCGRVKDGQFDKNIPLDELTVNDYQKLFLPQYSSTIRRLFFCGNFGDAAASNTLIPSLKYLKDAGYQSIDIVTNGSLRKPSWWADLAKILTGKKDSVIFSIDGLKDTNSIYRINSSWDKIMANVETFIAAGGRARWDMLVFSHNEHQVESAKALAKKMGFVGFNTKKTNRFIPAADSKKKIDIRDSQTLKSQENRIVTPKNKEFQGHSIEQAQKINTHYADWQDYCEKSEILCRYRNEYHGLFLDFEAKIWPCCWTAALPYSRSKLNKTEWLQLKKLYGEDFNSTRQSDLAKILQHPWFLSQLVKSWSPKESSEVPKLNVCSFNCSKDFSYSSATKQNRKIEKWDRENSIESHC